MSKHNSDQARLTSPEYQGKIEEMTYKQKTLALRNQQVFKPQKKSVSFTAHLPSYRQTHSPHSFKGHVETTKCIYNFIIKLLYNCTK